MDPMYQSMQEENENLVKALAYLEKQLEMTLIEKDQINALHLDFKAHYDQMVQQNTQFKKRLAEEHHARKDLEISQEQRLNDMKRAIDAKQREIEQMQNKMTLPIDSDIMRMKIQKDIEGRHRIELDQKQQENERMSEQYYESKRQLEVVKTQLDTFKHESEKELNDLREKHKQEVHEMMLENQALQSRADDKRDRELIRQLRRDLDENKRRITELLTDSTDLRRERDLAKMERNEMMIQFTKDLEEERNQKRVIQSELDRVQFKLQCAEEEKQKLLIKVEKKQSEIAHTQMEKNKYENILREKDSMIDTLNKQGQQLKEDLKQSEQQQAHLLQRLQDEERDFHMRQRKEVSKLQKEIEQLQVQILEQESNKRFDLEKSHSEFDRIQREYRIVSEEKRMAQMRVQDIQNEFESYRRQFEDRKYDQDLYENELRKLQDKHRECMQQIYQLKTDKEHLEKSLQLAQSEVNKFNDGFDAEIQMRNKERMDLQLKIQELITTNEKQKLENNRQIETYKSKYSQYKTKLKQANNSIHTLAERVAKYELQMVAERDGADIQSAHALGSARNIPSKINRRGQYSSQGMISDDEFNLNELQNDKMNEEIRKLLEENRRALQ
ncbi:UNKNOWN [Stylonychia lemnae]|uniref:Uncharacterized protein n=1 Tax=Stylonychia lemnae TaxID=5949 RepID=A0A078AUT8_STYLE|nr:UNKNOWN [Stylonychia lemnae]|eukprot:CDW85959.1 UNKNOWN [Stylonychia lemnae]